MATLLEKHGFRFINYPDGEEVAEQLHFSHAVIVPPNAQTVIISGQAGILPDGSVPEDLKTEFKQAFLNVKKALNAVGFGENALEYVFDVTYYFAGGFDAGPLAELAKSLFKATRPTAVGIEIANLFRPDLHLEIRVVACLPS